MSKKLVLMDHDGGLDDYLATMLLMTMNNIELLGIIVTPADCYIQPAVNATRKILDLMERSDIPVAESTVRGINPFPRPYRRASFTVDYLPILNQKQTIETPLRSQTGQEFMVRSLLDAPEPVTLLVTGPLTTVATALELNPKIKAKIKEIVWMGGALSVAGNVSREHEPGHDGSAEWNVYWDAVSAHQVWQTDIPVILCPLDLTNHVPLTPKFLQQLARLRQYPLADLAGQCLATVIHEDYYLWDVITTAYLAKPELYEVNQRETVIVTKGRSEGRTKLELGGKKIQVMDKVDQDSFYDYILQQWSS